MTQAILDADTAARAFFARDLARDDAPVQAALDAELRRQRDQIELIASENIVSPAVLKAQGSVLTNKYAEGYPGKRYYGGCEYVDVTEQLAIDRAKALFGADFANVQPHSGAQANMAVLFALLQPGDTILGLGLAHGGHLTHGAAPTVSGRWFKPVAYGVDPVTQVIDYDAVESLAREHQPKLIIAGGSAYPRTLDFARFRAIADAVGALLMVDMAHIAGLVAGGVHPNPVPHAHVVTTTTHKTVAFGEALEPSFKAYARQVAANAKVLAQGLADRGAAIVSGGTDTHVVLVDLRPKGLTGKLAERALDEAGITCNKNGIPFDPAKPAVTSGIRLGTPACTTRGFGEAEFAKVAELIDRVLEAARAGEGLDEVSAAVRAEVQALCRAFPIYPGA